MVPEKVFAALLEHDDTLSMDTLRMLTTMPGMLRNRAEAILSMPERIAVRLPLRWRWESGMRGAGR
jgi:hypothetical protein